MYMIDCFTKLPISSTINDDLMNVCDNGTPWIDPKIGTFYQKHPSRDLIYGDSFLKFVCDQYLNYDFGTSVNIFMLRPWSHYHLHTDKYRPSSINLLLNTDADSISYFQVSDFQKLQCSILELNYEPKHYYLFNSQVPHAVLNKDKERYILSISLKHDYATMKRLLTDHIFLYSSGNTLI